MIATLIYLALQVRQNTRALDENIAAAKIQSRATMSQAAVASIRHARTDDTLITIFAKNIAGEELTVAESIKLDIYIRELFRLAEHDFFLYRNDLLDDDEFFGTRVFYLDFFAQEVSRNFWEEHKDEFPLNFREEIDQAIFEHA